MYSLDRERVIKILLDRYCRYLFDQSNKDLELIFDKDTLTFEEAYAKTKKEAGEVRAKPDKDRK